MRGKRTLRTIENYKPVEKFDVLDYIIQIKQLDYELSLIKKSINREVKRIEDSLTEIKKEGEILL